MSDWMQRLAERRREKPEVDRMEQVLCILFYIMLALGVVSIVFVFVKGVMQL